MTLALKHAPLKIVFVMASESHGGAAIMTFRQAQGLAKLGHEVRLYCAGPKASTRKDKGVFIEILEQPNPLAIYHYFNPSLIARLMFRLRSFKPDVLHFIAINLRTFSLTALELSHLYPTVWTLKDVWSLCMIGWPNPPDCNDMINGCMNCPTWPKWQVKLNRFLKETIFATSPLQVAVPSMWLAKLIRKNSYLGKKPITVIPNGLEPESWHFGAFRNYSKQSQFNEKPVKILYPAGRLLSGIMPAERKGWPVLAKAIKILATEHFSFEVLFVGDIDSSAKNKFSDLPIRWVHGCSHDQIRQLYKEADIFVLPSLGDNFPATVFEAMAAGLPVISTWTGGIPEAVIHEQTGILAQPRDHEAIAIGLKRLIKDRELREKLGRAGRDRFERRFTSARMISSYNSLFYQVKENFGRQ